MARGKVSGLATKKVLALLLQRTARMYSYITAIQGEGYKSLAEGQEVEFEITNGPKGEQAQTS